MPDVWTIVSENSTLITGDFWEHLNNQSGEVILIGTTQTADITRSATSTQSGILVSTTVDIVAVSADLNQEYTADLNQEYTADLNQEYTAEVN